MHCGSVFISVEKLKAGLKAHEEEYIYYYGCFTCINAEMHTLHLHKTPAMPTPISLWHLRLLDNGPTDICIVFILGLQ